jgi:NitT/TauT family transport system ATP-binding protein
MTIFMITHDLKESFQLGTRLLVFDKRRNDPHSPERYGATVTYDIPLNRKKHTLPLPTLTSELVRP